MFIDGSDGNRINDTMAHKVGREHLPDGGVAIIEGTLPPGGFIGPRTHTREDEITYVIEGEMTFDVGGIRHVAVAGAYVVKLRGVPHAFWNPSDRSARLMEIHAPGGFERSTTIWSGSCPIKAWGRMSASSDSSHQPRYTRSNMIWSEALASELSSACPDPRGDEARANA